ncbi:Pancreatic triacylglycerol lipase [Pseudolycoriella hygida]|uniref:Pancreatic triacylglycerol lipase n=1 Tax=Pseudolycoriella hygida TaxID=35572 RepID=A0A9Q0NFZ2_9DIPT|nr:Pancreatic triacylglycerol lipase [Pseudolycoriella hygida]
MNNMFLKLEKTLFFFILYYVESFCISTLSDEDLNTVSLYYYSPSHISEQIIGPNTTLIDFASDLPTKLIIHGYIAHRNHGSVEPVKNAYLGRGDTNVILADWEQLAHKLYDESRSYVRQIGVRVGALLSVYIKNQNVTFDDIHVVGHSLGAHIAGNVGRHFDGQLSRITGLDPAAPLFTNLSIDAIKQSDGQFVDIIHTGGYSLGEIWTRGHVDFYPNSGIFHQPGCRKDDLLTLFSCSHFRAPLYFAESILLPNSFVAVKCTFKDILSDTPNKCANSVETVFMGDIVPKEYATAFARGTYYLTTNEVYPFGRGNYSQFGIL